MRSTPAFAALAAAASLLVLPAAASASNRFVGPNGVDTGTCLALPCKTITYAVGKAIEGDTINVAPGDYEQGAIVDKRVTLRGAGAGGVGQPADPAKHTIIHRLAGDTLALRAGGALRDLRVIAGDDGDGLMLSGVSSAGDDAYEIRDVVAEAGDGHDAVLITGSSSQAPVAVQWAGGGAGTEGNVQFSSGGHHGAVQVQTAGAGLRIEDAALHGRLLATRGSVVGERLRIDGPVGAETIEGSLTLRRSTIATTRAGLVLFNLDTGAAALRVEDSVVDVAGAGDAGCFGFFSLEGGSASSAHAVLERTTVRVRCMGSVAVGVGGLGEVDAPAGPTLDLRSTVVMAEGADAADVLSYGSALMVTAEHSAFTTVRGDATVPQPGSGTNVLGPLALEEDLRPGPGSVLIDHGDPAAAGVSDLAGAARTADGDADGEAVPDIGAYEAAAGTNPVPVPRVPAPGPSTDPASAGSSGALDTGAATTAPAVGQMAPGAASSLTLGKLRLVGTPRARHAVKVRVTLSAPATVTVTLRRGARTVSKRTVKLAAGTRTIVVPGRRLRAGRHALRLTAKGADGRVVRSTVPLSVRAA